VNDDASFVIQAGSMEETVGSRVDSKCGHWKAVTKLHSLANKFVEIEMRHLTHINAVPNGRNERHLLMQESDPVFFQLVEIQLEAKLRYLNVKVREMLFRGVLSTHQLGDEKQPSILSWTVHIHIGLNKTILIFWFLRPVHSRRGWLFGSFGAFRVLHFEYLILARDTSFL